MSRQTKFSLDFKNGVVIRVRLSSTNGHTDNQLKQGSDGRPVRTIKVLPKPDRDAVTSIDDIEKVVPWGKLQSLFVHHNEQTQSVDYITIDDKSIKALFPSSETIRVISVIPRSELNYSMMEGHHYYISVQSEHKSHNIFTDDQVYMSVLYHALRDRNLVLIGRYISANHEKTCAIHPENGGLTMSVLIPSNFTRERSDNHIKDDIEHSVRLGSKLFKNFEQDHFDDDCSRDTYDDRLREYIEQTRDEHQSGTSRIKVKLNVTRPAAAPSVKNAMDRLFSLS